MQRIIFIFLKVAIVSLLLVLFGGCAHVSNSANDHEESTVDTLIIGNDTIVVSKIPPEKEVLPLDSLSIIDSVKYKPVSYKKNKIVQKAPAYPVVEKDHVVTDSVGRKYVDNRLCVVIRNQNAGSSVLDKWERQFKSLYPDSQYYVTYKEPFALVMQISVPADKRKAVRDTIQSQIKGIKFIVVDEEIIEPSETKRYNPNDPIFNNSIFSTLGYDWYFDMIQAKEAWAISKGSEKVTVAIVDDYFDLNHPELNSYNIVDPYSVENGTRDVLPKDSSTIGHGTLVASLALGKMDNHRGACGIAPKCSFMPISLGGSEVASGCVVVGLLRAIHNGADVVNISLGWAANFTDEGISIKDQIKWSRRNLKRLEEMWNYIYEVAEARNVVIVYAAGNERDYIAVDPKKRSDNIICVSSVNMDGEWSSRFSNVGNFPDYDVHASTLSAPGEYMFGALPFNSYQIDLTPSCGTSYAAPLVTGAVALMKSVDNSLSVKEIINILQRTGKPVEGKGGQAIGNIIQIYDALDEVKNGLSCFSDFVRNPIGLWGDIEQSKCYKILNEVTGEVGPYSGQTRHYFKITSVNNYGVCGEQIVCQVTDVKKLVYWPMADNIYMDTDLRESWKSGKKKGYDPERTYWGVYNNMALSAVSNRNDGYLSFDKNGYYGARKMLFCKGPNGTLVVHTWDKWNGYSAHTLKRYKKIKREYKSEL